MSRRWRSARSRPRRHRRRGGDRDLAERGRVERVRGLDADADRRRRPSSSPPRSADCQTQSPIAGLPLKLADTRGPFTFSVYADSNSSATCIKGPTFTAVSEHPRAPRSTCRPATSCCRSSHASDRGGAAYSFADGRTGDGVSAVTLILDDGTNVRRRSRTGGSSPGGPAAQAVKSADITTPAGTTTQTFDLANGRPVRAPGRAPAAGSAAAHPAAESAGGVGGGVGGGPAGP